MDGGAFTQEAAALGGFGVGACGFYCFDHFCDDGADRGQYRTEAPDWPDD